MKCPGQDSRYWKPGAIFEAVCPQCGNEVEFFKDDTTRRCKKCGHLFLNPEMDFGCAAYCRFAEQCIGNLPPELIAQKKNLLKDRVAVEMKRLFKKDFKRIGHASRAARYAERIGKAEGGDPAVILIAAYLHEIGTVQAETDGDSGSVQGNQAAEELLKRLGAGDTLIREVCGIIEKSRRSEPEDQGINFRCFHDADLIAHLEEKKKKGSLKPDELEKAVAGSFLTKSGVRLAGEILSGDAEPNQEKR